MPFSVALLPPSVQTLRAEAESAIADFGRQVREASGNQTLMMLLRNKHQNVKECRWHTRHFIRIIDRLRDTPMVGSWVRAAGASQRRGLR